MSSMWYLYVVKCADSTLYTGITTNVDRRINEHNHTKRGAKYTRGRRPVILLSYALFRNRSDASKAEYSFKQLSRKNKLKACEGPDLLLK